MKNFHTHISNLCLCMLVLSCMLYSCEGTEIEPDNPDIPTVIGSAIMLPNEVGATVEMTLDMETDWDIDNSNSWFSIQPFSGPAGNTTFTVTVLENNSEISERVSTFLINENGEAAQYYAVQDVAPSIAFSSRHSAQTGTEADGVSFTFLSNTDVEVTSGADWITINNIAVDSTLIDNLDLYSKLQSYTVDLSINANSGKARDGAVIISGISSEDTDADALQAEFLVQQYGELTDPDYTRDFIRRSLTIRFTGTWCGYCPSMNVALSDAVNQYPDHIIPMNMYQGSGALSFEDVNEFITHFNIAGFPTAIVNYYAQVGNLASASTTTGYFVKLAAEAVNELPARTVIGGDMTLVGNELVLNLGIAAKEAGDYNLSIFLIENGIIGEQTDYSGIIDDPSAYEHNNVIRHEYTDMLGDPVTMNHNSFKSMTFNLEIPSNVEVPENLLAVVVTSYNGTYTGSQNYVTYDDYGSVVDNAVSIPIGGYAVLGYE